MRTIKFRAWDKQQRRWLTIDRYTADSITAMARRVTGIDWFLFPDSCNPDAELMQYTGLKDRHGVEIYEGDIVDYRYGDMSGGQAVVIFSEGCFEVGDGYASSLAAMRELEVIGNAYEGSHSGEK